MNLLQLLPPDTYHLYDSKVLVELGDSLLDKSSNKAHLLSFLLDIFFPENTKSTIIFHNSYRHIKITCYYSYMFQEIKRIFKIKLPKLIIW